MTVKVNIAENVECLEVEDGEVFDRPREVVEIVQEQLKNRMRNGRNR